MLCSNGRYCLPCEGRAAVAGSVVTLLLREPGQLGWLADLQSFSGAPGSDAGSASQAAGAAWAGGELPAPPAPALDWAVGLSSSAVRYEPLDASMAAAVLTAGSISWQARRGQSQSSVHARRLALHVAGPSSSSGARGSPAKGLQCGFASSASQADMAGFHQVAAEAGISIQLPQQAQQQQADPQQPGQAVQQAAAMQEVVVTNRGLSISLSRRTLLLLQRLAQQLPSRGPGQGTQRAASAMGASVILGWEGSAASLAASVASACSEGGRQGAPLNVMQGVVQSAYAAPRRPAEHPMEASVFLDGAPAQLGKLLAIAPAVHATSSCPCYSRPSPA